MKQDESVFLSITPSKNDNVSLYSNCTSREEEEAGRRSRSVTSVRGFRSLALSNLEKSCYKNNRKKKTIKDKVFFFLSILDYPFSLIQLRPWPWKKFRSFFDIERYFRPIVASDMFGVSCWPCGTHSKPRGAVSLGRQRGRQPRHRRYEKHRRRARNRPPKP